jgi:drug/metabolite transporter (DMT)-like permease
MESRAKVPGAVVAGLFMAVALDTGVQIVWKNAVAGIPDGASASAVVAGALGNRCFYLAMLGFLAQFVNWMRVLARADLSFAQPITALSYISILAASRYYLHERISPARVLGVCLILLGVYFISRTPHLTVPARDDERRPAR